MMLLHAFQAAYLGAIREELAIANVRNAAAVSVIAARFDKRRIRAPSADSRRARLS
ncbi:MAG TPA: hypothetical protein VHT00_04165 [Stellaceae bacterium]|jgi:hypothetical protein|nr:hypothetical protein [Stellaceae bacterium]